MLTTRAGMSSDNLRTQTKVKATAALIMLSVLLLINLGMEATFKGSVGSVENTWIGSAGQASRHLFSNHVTEEQLSPESPSGPGIGHNYIFGYGSLMDHRSRSKTGKTGSTYPVIINNMKRSWDYAQPKRGMTALGVLRVPGFQTSGVLTLVPRYSLPSFDEREVKYTRHEIAHQDVKFFNPDAAFLLKPNDKIWVYVVDEPVAPSTPLPIAQSYVDVCMEGSLEYGEEFAKLFVKTTHLWSKSESIGEEQTKKLAASEKQVWVDDRQEPLIYEKGFVSHEKVETIDRILSDLVPKAFATRIPLHHAFGAMKGHVEPEMKDSEKEDWVTPHIRE